MVNMWNEQAYGKQNTGKERNDVWGEIPVNNWFIPSRAEWAAFAKEFGITKSNYRKFSLQPWYWSSSQYNDSNACAIYFEHGYVFDGWVHGTVYTRLATTF